MCDLFKKQVFSLSFLLLLQFALQAQNLQLSLGSTQAIPPDFFGFNGANVVRTSNPSYNTQWLIDSIGLFGPSTVRYPAGVPGNFWDWQKGTLSPPLSTYSLPQEYDNYSNKVNKLDQYKTMVDYLGLTPLQNINVLSSDPYYETARLYYSRGLNLPVKYLEFGSELYDDEYPEYLSKWSTPTDYALDMNNWASIIRSFPGSTEYKIAVCGATNRLSIEVPESRRNKWTADVSANISSQIDAVTLHHYISSSLEPSVAATLTTLPQILAMPYKRMNDLIVKDLPAIKSAGKEAWITEYNVFDRSHCLQGTWAQGLMVAAMTLLFQEDTTIKLVNFHSMVADGVWGSVFNDSADLDINSFYSGVSCVPNPPAARVKERTGAGNAMMLIGQAFKGSTSTRRINFTNNPVLYDAYKSVLGYHFDGPLATQGIIINLSGTNQTVDVSTNAWNLSGYKYEQMKAGVGGPLALIKGSALETGGGSNDILTTGLKDVTGQTITLAPYSITRLVKQKTGLVLKVVDNTICSGTKTSVSAFGVGGYTWTPQANLVQLKADNSVMQFSASVTTNTVFTVTATDKNGTTATATITVYVKPKLTATATLGFACKNIPIKLAATFTGGNAANFNSFIWLPSGEVDNPFSDVVNVNPRKTTTYTVYATDGLCWSAMDSVKVTVTNNADATESRLVCRDSLPLKLSSLITKYKYSYNWYNGGTFIGTGKNIYVSPDTTTTYSLVMQSTIDPYCVDTDYVTVTPITCCGSKDTSLLTFGPIIKMSQIAARLKSYVTATGYGSATTNSVTGLTKEIVVNGRLMVDSDYTFTNCSKIKFGDNAEVIFGGEGAHLTFNNCKLSAAECSGKMWAGFRFADWNESLVINNSTVSDAKVAVLATLNPSITLTNSVFKNNYIALEARTMESYFSPVIYGDTFTYTALLPPYAGMKPHSGIKLFDVNNITIGKGGVPKNVFSGMMYGIYAENSHLTLYNNNFVNLTNSNTGDVNEGSAVYANNLNGYGDITNPDHAWEVFHVTAGSAANPNTFDNCYYGVNAINQELTMVSNVFNNVNNAISCVGCLKRDLTFTSNLMDSVGVGINLIEPKLSKVTINNNTILTSTHATLISNVAGINVSDNNTYPCILSIKNNIVTNYGKYGINVVNNFEPVIIENKVYMKMPSTAVDVYALRVFNCDSVALNCNYVGSSNTTIGRRIGVSASFCPGSDFRCNIIDKCYTGMEFWGDCNNSLIKHNELNYLAVGMAVGKSGGTPGIIGPQPINSGGKPVNNVFRGQYTVSGGVGAKKGYFSYAATLAINSNLAGSKTDLTRYHVYKGYYSAANDSLQVPYQNKHEGTGVSLTPYYSTNTPTTCDVNCTMQTSKVSPLTSDDEDAESVDVSTLIQNNNDALSQVTDPLLRYSIMRKQEMLQGWNEVNDNAASALENVKHEMQRLHAQPSYKLAGLINKNDEVVATHLFEQNDKVLNDIELKYMLNKQNKFEEPQLLLIRKIARQCPTLGGTAVYRARAMYQTVYPTYFFDDDKICTKSTLQGLQIQEERMIDAEVMPNPASSILQVVLSDQTQEPLIIVITDMQGRVVVKSRFAVGTSQVTLDISNLARDIYMLNITSLQNEVLCRKKVTVQ